VADDLQAGGGIAHAATLRRVTAIPVHVLAGC
jgi:hypothetical protein